MKHFFESMCLANFTVGYFYRNYCNHSLARLGELIGVSGSAMHFSWFVQLVFMYLLYVRTKCMCESNFLKEDVFTNFAGRC